MADRYEWKPEDMPTTPFPLMDHCILLGKRGSEAHGTYVPPTEPTSLDDRDLMGICIPPVDYYYGLKQWDGADAIKGPWDTVLYPLQKFMRLLIRQNPNVLCMLWLEAEDYHLKTPEGEHLIANRDLFRSKKAAYEAIVGYARHQLHRMTHIAVTGEGTHRLGAKRKALVEAFGYDTKNAAHMVRLLLMGNEYLRTGHLQVRRTGDRKIILEIKRGEWTRLNVELYATRLFAECDNAYEYSALPEQCDEAKINELAVNLTQSWMTRLRHKKEFGGT
jgi:predicted nucleotidyltransferase